MHIFVYCGPLYEKLAVIFSPCYTYVCSVMSGLTALKFLFTWVRPGPPKYEKKYIFFHILVLNLIVSPERSTYGGYYGLVVVTPRPRPQTLHRSHDNLKNPYRIASIFYM